MKSFRVHPRDPSSPAALRRRSGGCSSSSVAGVLLASLLAISTGCRKSSDEDLQLTPDPKKAASLMESAFDTGSEEARTAAAAAAEAMRTQNYEKAVASLQVARSAVGVSLKQGVAIHSMVVALEGELLVAIQNGDPKARQAYELLKAMKSQGNDSMGR